MPPEAPSSLTSYTEWRNQFAREGLRVLYFLGLVANPIFLVTDVFFCREPLLNFLVLGAINVKGI